ncbi:MAG TPA: DUF4440 domain-containing protein [Draconibacterium sp.]|nr:DUF4440 domain-containing protein [Draconibacterium sp.]
MKQTFLSFLILLLISCGQTETPDVKQLFEADKSFSDASGKIGYAKAFIDFAHPDVAFLRDNSMPVVGKTAVQRLFENAPSTGLNFSWEPLGGDIAKSGELGYTYGVYTITQDSVIEKGTYVSVWKKDGNGQWKYILDSGNEGIGQ